MVCKKFRKNYKEFNPALRKLVAQGYFFTKFVNKHSNNSKFLSGSNESEILSYLKIYVNKNNSFEKDSYSIFKNKKLTGKLKRYEEIYLCGVEADACVLFSAAEAYDLFLDFKIIKEAVAGFDIFRNKNVFENYYKNHFGITSLISIKEILKHTSMSE